MAPVSKSCVKTSLTNGNGQGLEHLFSRAKFGKLKVKRLSRLSEVFLNFG